MKTIKFFAFSFLVFCAIAVTSCATKTATESTETQEDTTEVAETSDVDVVTELMPEYTIPTTLEKPLVIDFSATWCGPCQQFKPIFHKVAAAYADKVDFASCDVDECSNLASEYDVQNIPFILGIRTNGTTTHTIGLMTEDEFITFVEGLLQ